MSAIVHPERYDPSEGNRGLIDVEHHARYWWASQVVEGRAVLDAGCGLGYGSGILAAAGASRVVGIDLDAEAVAAAAAACGPRVETVQGDVRKMPFERDQFDLIACFETIEHIEEGEIALREFKRVLRPGGLLLLSSPNRGVYPEGNEHHVREYTAGELMEATSALFANVGRWRQQAWVASSLDAMDDEAPRIFRRSGVAPDQEVFTLTAASDEPLPELSGVTVLGDAFDVRWWSGQLHQAESQLTAAQHDAAYVLERERQAHAETQERLHSSNRRVLEIEQELASVPALSRRVAELEAERGRCWSLLAEQRQGFERSLSWRLTAPLRTLARLARRFS